MQTVQKVTYYRDTDHFHGVTDESPKDFPNVKVGRGPRDFAGIESIEERCYSEAELLRVTKVEAADVPDEWFEAIGYEERPVEAVKPEPKPNYQTMKHEYTFEMKDFDKDYEFEFLPSKKAGEVLVRVSKRLGPNESFQGEPRHDREPAPVEITTVEPEPSAISRFVNDSLFPKLLMVGFVIFCLIVKACI